MTNMGWPALLSILAGVGVATVFGFIAGVLIVKFHRAVANNLAHGVQSYDKVTLFGIIAIILGMIFMSNLHSLLLYFIFHLIMPNRFP